MTEVVEDIVIVGGFGIAGLGYIFRTSRELGSGEMAWLQEAGVSRKIGMRGYVITSGVHGFEPKFPGRFFGKGIRCGFRPCDDQGVYWFLTWTPSIQGN
ncbi:hypothetical protein Pint_34252 [Pistacia integerrima]|uniref:Uncharacterized protein n=1 Tax=Pistacia integerrima TaxID=434235 RepID=A0ACC0X490_9ROSI|nr:hypothetical protein Pint_34252 [Pistacia integerrima]